MNLTHLGLLIVILAGWNYFEFMFFEIGEENMNFIFSNQFKNSYVESC